MSDAALRGRLNHVAIVVSDLDAREAAWRRLFALPAARPPRLTAVGVEYTTFEVGGVTLELIKPQSADTVYARFLREHGEGVHHLCFEVPDIAALCLTDVARGLPELAVRTTADGRRLIDLAPEGFGGVSVQLCQLPGAAA